jgi:cytochrome c-type biogenesis protein
MQQLFENLNQILEHSSAWALPAVFVWGILSILLSPCHLASIPLIIGFIDEQEIKSTQRAFWVSTLFSLGLLLTIALIGIITALAGRIMGDIGAYGNYIVAAIFMVIGLHLLEVISIPWNAPGKIGIKSKGFLAAFILGLVFGIALGPCTFAFLAPILAITLKTSAEDIAFGILLLFIYGIGHCSVIVIAGTSTSLVQRYLNWNEKSSGAIILKKICGILVIAGGCYLIYTAP